MISDKIFNSKTHMKKILKTMMKNDKVIRLKYDHQAKKFPGFKVNQEKAFKNTHPDVLL